MKKLLFLLISYSLPFIPVTAQSWLWADGSSTYSAFDCIISNGDCYISGEFYSDYTIQFGNFKLVNNNKTYSDFESFLVKYNSSGVVLWAKQSLIINHNDSLITDGPYVIACDKSGNVYLNGGFDDTIVLAPETLITNIARPITENRFLAKYSPTGNVIWAKAPKLLNDSSSIALSAIATDKLNNIYISGSFIDSLKFGSQTIGTPNSNTAYTYIVKYDSNGNAKWAKQPTHAYGGLQPYGITTDNYFNAIITGIFDDTLIFDTIKLVTITSQTGGDMFVTKYDSSGKVLWAKQAVLLNDYSGIGGSAITTDPNNSIYVAGGYSRICILGKDTLPDNPNSIFIAKYSPKGEVMWTKVGMGLEKNSVWGIGSISSDSHGHIFFSAYGGVSGQNMFTLGGDTLTLLDNNAKGASVIFELDTAGNVLCSSIVDGGAIVGNGVASDTSGNYIYLAASETGGAMIFGKNDSANNVVTARWLPCGDSAVFVGSDKEKGVSNRAVVYPNPNSGVFTLQMDNGQWTMIKLKFIIFMDRKLPLSVFPHTGEAQLFPIILT